jgi:hypothetical protein
MEKNCKVTLIGKSPLLMNRYAGETPSEAKAPRGKKTQEHIDAYRRKKWFRAAYWDVERGCFHVPPENLDSMLAAGAKKFRKGIDFKSDVSVQTLFIPLLDESGERYAGASLDEFFRPEHIDIRGVVIQKSRVDACRPIFRSWRVDFTVSYNAETITREEIEQALQRNCLGDFRPRFGQFSFTVSA